VEALPWKAVIDAGGVLAALIFVLFMQWDRDRRESKSTSQALADFGSVTGAH
jgi:hypothetical protein